MAKKIEINENWEPVEVEDLDNLFVVIFKHGSFDQGYVEAFDTDDVLMQSAYDSLAKQYDDCGCDKQTKIYLIKIPNTDQTTNMCNTGLFNGNCCDPHVIEATRDLFNRADCEHLSCWEGCGLTEGKKKKKVCSAITYTTGDPNLNIKHFNKCMGTDGLQNPNSQHLVVGDTLPNAPVAAAGEGSSDGTSASEGGAVGESLNESLEADIKEILTAGGDHDGKPHLFEVGEAKPGDNPWWIEKFDDGEVDFGNLTIYTRTPEEKENGKYIATFMISGGKNGSGNWTDYLSQLADAFKAIKEKTGAEPLLYKLDTDILDDVWTGYVFLYDHDDKVQESLNEDLIVIEPNEAKEKLTELQAQIKAEKDEKVRKSLLTLMNIYLFQTYKPSDREDSNITDDEWQEISDWHKDELEKEKEEQGVEENLTEAGDYWENVEKMKKLNAGTRGFNSSRCTPEQFRIKRQVCIDYKLWTALKIVEDAMIEKGLLDPSQRYNPKEKVDKNLLLTINDFHDDALKILIMHKNDTIALVNLSFKLALIYLLVALFSKNNAIASRIKDEILEHYDINLNELKTILNKHIDDKMINARIKAVCAVTESLDEDLFYSHHLMRAFELPGEIKLLDKTTVEEFVAQLSPEELFRVGYANPVYFYKELDDKFTLVKTTQLEGYTGLDYRDASATSTVADHDDRLANAQRQIDTYTNGASGHALNPEGERFSAKYKDTNKLTYNQKKTADGKYIDENGNEVSIHDLSKILFYPRVGSKPIVTYFLDLKDGKGFRKVKRELLQDTIYRRVKEMALAKDNGLTKDDLKRVQKYGFKDLLDYTTQYPGLTFDDYIKALKMGMDPHEYAKTYPYSRRWSYGDFQDKVAKMLDQDAATIEAKELADEMGMDRTLDKREAKPSVRALYVNQIYYLSSKYGTFGKIITESLLSEGCWGMPNTLAEVNKLKDLMMKPIDAFEVGDCPECKNKELGIGDDTLFDNIAKYRKEHGYGSEASGDVRKVIQDFIKDEVLPNWDSYSYSQPEGDYEGEVWEPGVKEVFQEIADLDLAELKKQWEAECKKAQEEAPEEMPDAVEEALDLNEAKRYVKRYYVRPLNIFCGNKEDIIQALIRAGDQNCSVYSLKRLDNHEDVHLLQPSDIIYYYDDHVLYDKNHVQVMDYDLFVKHEEDRKKVGNVNALSDATFSDMYDDRATEDDLKDKDVITNYKALNSISR